MAPDSKHPHYPLTQAELAELRPGLDLSALQELVDAAPEVRQIVLAALHSSGDQKHIFDAIDEANRREGLPPIDRPPSEPVTEPKWIQTPGPNGLTFLDEPHYDFQLDFGGDTRLQGLFSRVRGFPNSDA